MEVVSAYNTLEPGSAKITKDGKTISLTAEEIIEAYRSARCLDPAKEYTEDKGLFVKLLNHAFVAGDPERYGHIVADPIVYEKHIGDKMYEECIHPKNNPHYTRNVTGDSLTALARAYIELIQ